MEVLNFALDSLVFLEIVCAITATICLRKYKHSATKWIVVYLWTVCIIELLPTISPDLKVENVFLYNMLGIVEFSTLSYIFYKEINTAFFKKVVFTSIMIFALILSYNIWATHFQKNVFYNIAFGCSSLLISLYCCFYFYYVARTEKILHLYRTLLTWICIGLLVYHLCNLPITVLNNLLDVIDQDVSVLIILAICGSIMYICFIIGFLWSKKRYNYSLY